MSADLDQGTEGYKPYYNIGNAEITNFKVSENGREYTYDDSWIRMLHLMKKHIKME